MSNTILSAEIVDFIQKYYSDVHESTIQKAYKRFLDKQLDYNKRTYYHDARCNSSRNVPMGTEGYGCSCYMYQRALKAESELKKLTTHSLDEEALRKEA
jgi:hypothetical protein